MSGRKWCDILASLICGPADSGRWHGSDNSWLDTLEETLCSLSGVKELGTLNKATDVSQSGIRRGASGLEHGLDNVHRSGESSGETSSNSSGGAVSDWVVVLLWVHDGGDGLVGQELETVEWNSHGEGGWVGDVEGTETLGLVDVLRTCCHGWVEFLGALNLHTLLDD